MLTVHEAHDGFLINPAKAVHDRLVMIGHPAGN